MCKFQFVIFKKSHFNSVRNIWKRILTKAGLDHRKFHYTRHTFASILISKGVNLNFIKETMGHHSIQMTVDTYSHLLPAPNKSATNEDYEGSGNLVAMQGLDPPSGVTDLLNCVQDQTGLLFYTTFG